MRAETSKEVPQTAAEGHSNMEASLTKYQGGEGSPNLTPTISLSGERTSGSETCLRKLLLSKRKAPRVPNSGLASSLKRGFESGDSSVNKRQERTDRFHNSDTSGIPHKRSNLGQAPDSADNERKVFQYDNKGNHNLG